MADSQASGRRSALHKIGGILVGVLGGALGVALMAPSVVALLDPLRRRRQKAESETPRVKVAETSEIPNLDAGAPPLRAAVVASGLRDAWNRLDNTKLGSVFLGKRSGALSCLSATCPHAGCGIDFDDKRQKFVCPCHNSTFDIDGKREDGPSPRDMDKLEVVVDGDGVYCLFQRFRLAVSGKVPV
jgi:menaquinol-cytochrome c reductase iron-sulfur subunit